jgi:hypothetical protein
VIIIKRQFLKAIILFLVTKLTGKKDIQLSTSIFNENDYRSFDRLIISSLLLFTKGVIHKLHHGCVERGKEFCDDYVHASKIKAAWNMGLKNVKKT